MHACQTSPLQHPARSMMTRLLLWSGGMKPEELGLSEKAPPFPLWDLPKAASGRCRTCAGTSELKHCRPGTFQSTEGASRIANIMARYSTIMSSTSNVPQNGISNNFDLDVNTVHPASMFQEMADYCSVAAPLSRMPFPTACSGTTSLAGTRASIALATELSSP